MNTLENSEGKGSEGRLDVQSPIPVNLAGGKSNTHHWTKPKKSKPIKNPIGNRQEESSNNKKYQHDSNILNKVFSILLLINNNSFIYLGKVTENLRPSS